MTAVEYYLQFLSFMNVIQVLLLTLIQLYRRLISPLLPPTCRFQPTCSAYAMDAIRGHGALSGGWLALKRIFRCHPWGGSGYDPVPPLPCSCDRHPDLNP
jgi:uncharacterized protein